MIDNEVYDLDKRLSMYEVERTRINLMDIEQIQIMVYKYYTAVENRDTTKAKILFDLIRKIAKNKQGLASVQEFFDGKRIGRHKKSIDIMMATEYVSYIGDAIRASQDERVKPSPVN